jgi:TPR repeat protein
MYEGWNPLCTYSKISLKGNGIESIEIDFAQAAKYYKLSVELFCDSDAYAHDAADSAYALAKMYDEGRGVDQNFEEAARLLQIGVGQENQDCKIHLACMFEEGRGVVKNLDTAARMFIKLFEDDDVDYDHDDDYDYDYDDDYKERVFCRRASMYIFTPRFCYKMHRVLPKNQRLVPK